MGSCRGEPLIPSVRELISMGIGFELILIFLEIINEKSALQNITGCPGNTADILHDFRDYKILGTLKSEIKKAEAHWSTLANSIRQKEVCCTDHNEATGNGVYGRRYEETYGEIVKDGRGYRKLDNKLASISQ